MLAKVVDMEPEKPTRPHPKVVGDASEAMIIARLVQAGKMILLPFGENHRYDLVLDEGDRFIKVQCKTGRLKNGVVLFPTCSTTYHFPKNQPSTFYQRDYAKDADLFGVYCPDNDSVYLVPVAEVGKRAASLRLEPSRNGQAKRIRWAKDYYLGNSPG